MVNRKKRSAECNVARVEGFIDGVPFVQYFKRRKWAEKVARAQSATLIDLITGDRFEYADGWLKKSGVVL